MADLLKAVAFADLIGSRALERWGSESQTRMLIEESGELLTAVARRARGRSSSADVVEECADVIMVALQVARAHSGPGGQSDLALELERKAERLRLRLDEKGAA